MRKASNQSGNPLRSVNGFNGGLMRLFILAFGLFCLGCAVGDTADDATGSGSSGKSDGQDVDLSAALASGYNFTLSSALAIAEADDEDPAETYILSMAGLIFKETMDGQTILTFRPCMVQLPEVNGRVAEIEPSTVENVPTFSVSVELESVDDEVRLRTSNGVLLAGVELSDPLSEAIPESKRDDRLVDVDDDGYPGMSLMVDGWKVYTAMRIKMMLDGRVSDDGAVAGDGTLSIEFGMYGDNVPLVNAASAAEEALEKLQVERQEHLFEFAPASGDQMGCDAVSLAPLSHTELTQEP